MLGFGETATYLGYIALREHFPQMALRPNPDCTNNWCRKQQERYRVRKAAEAAEAARAPKAAVEVAAPVELHASNEWGIEIGDGDDSDGGGEGSSAAAAGGPALADGVVYAHVSSSQSAPTVKKEDEVGSGAALNLDDLMAQLKGVQS